MNLRPIKGVGLGLRRALLEPLQSTSCDQIQFFEVAPENWMNVGGTLGRQFRKLTEAHAFICHGLSLNLGGVAPLDEAFLHRLKQFINEHQIQIYSEHLSYCADHGHLYDLMPIPFTQEAVNYVSQRIQRVQEILGQRMVIENVSYYAAPGQEMQEIEFINQVLQQADCDLLLDVNNIYVNSINHQYDAEKFLKGMPGERIRYIHMAGHYDEAEDLKVDTHGAAVIAPVWKLLDTAYEHFGVFPTLLERDFNIPPLSELLRELSVIAEVQQKHLLQTDPGYGSA